MATTPQHIAQLVQDLGESGFERSLAPGKWTVSQILCHLADTELAFAFRIRQALAEDNHVIQPFDQDGWAKPYGQLDGNVALKVFETVREWNIALVKTLPDGIGSKPLKHPERGELTFGTLLETIAGHDRNHLEQLRQISSTKN